MTRVLITGASGSFGSALIRNLLASKVPPEKIVAYSRNESVQAKLRESLDYPATVEWILGDIRSPESLYDAMHRIDTIIHAAAMKRVDGNDPREMYSINIDGTIQVIRAALKRNVPKVLVLSSDKAAAPATAYGASKLAAEFYAVHANKWGRPHTRISCTRWGNVLGSAGSVILTWRRQAAAGLPITITVPEATRFWITMDRVVGFAIAAISLMEGGEVYIPAMESASLATLAEVVAPGAKQRRIPLRAGEKLHEVVISADEARRATLINSVYGVDFEHYVIKSTDATVGAVRGEVSSRTARKLDPNVLKGMLG